MNNMHTRCPGKFVIATQWVALPMVILNINRLRLWKGASCSNKNDTGVRNPETGTCNGPDFRATRSAPVGACAGAKWLAIIEVCPEWRYRLGVRTEDSQSSNPGSIPGSATSYHPLKPAKSAGFILAQKGCWHFLTSIPGLSGTQNGTQRRRVAGCCPARLSEPGFAATHHGLPDDQTKFFLIGTDHPPPVPIFLCSQGLRRNRPCVSDRNLDLGG